MRIDRRPADPSDDDLGVEFGAEVFNRLRLTYAVSVVPA